MPEYTFRLTIIFQTLENDTQLAEALFFPEISRFGEKVKKLENALKENTSRLVEEGDALALYRRRYTGEVEFGEARVMINPPPKSLAWQKPVELSFHIARFRHGDEAHLAFIPALGIEIIGKDADELTEKIPDEIRAHLLRIKKSRSLGELFWLQRAKEMVLVSSSFSATIRTPKQLARSLDAADEDKKSVLAEVATDLTKENLPQAFEMDEAVSRLADALTGRHPRSILLVGKSGVGKTALVYELVRRRQEYRLSRTPFYATSGARLVAGMSGFGMWQERCAKVWREAAKLKAILQFGNLLELMEVGKSTASTQGIAAFFRPYISRGDLLCIAECTPEQLPVIEREAPNLLDAFLQIKVEEPTPERGTTILLNYAVAQSQRTSAPIDFEGIEALDRLHRRYATYSAYPGRPLRFLKNLLQDRQGETITARVVTERFSEETGLPLFLLNEDVTLDLSATHDWFTERVIGQAEAVNLVVDLLATVKAKLTRAGKPIASLMFIGPTGVGKTEMAKSLAEFLFRHRHRLIRFDMSEYSDGLSVSRLIGGLWGKEGLLTAKVREQPFAVILLDEFEKAHPAFFDLLLQVLGEGRLTDAFGRVADFTNAVVIMTSNLGAESYKRDALGFRDATDTTAKARDHFMKAVRAFVRPEFFNRLDRIVPFSPLDEATVLLIARRELERLSRRDGILYRGVDLNISNQVADFLARTGYDARYGARPLKRAVERELLAPLAEALNGQTRDTLLSADVSVEVNRLAVEVHPKIDAAGRVMSRTSKSAPFASLVADAAALRRKAQNLNTSATAQEIQNEVFNLERLALRLAKSRVKNKWQDPEQAASLARLPELKRQLQTLAAFADRVAKFEDDVLLCFYGKALGDKTALQSEFTQLAHEWDSVLLNIYGLKFRKPDVVTLALYSENANWLFELARIYFEIADLAGANVELWQFVVPSDQESETIKALMKAGEKVEVYHLFDRVIVKRSVEKPTDFIATSHPQTVGMIFGITGELAFPKYEPERGIHTLTAEKHSHKCLVHTSESRPEDYEQPKGLEKRGSIAYQEKRRLYNRDESFCEDFELKEKFYLDRDNLSFVVRYSLERRMLKDAQAMLED
jgi:ATP-dependent Clp protease ATP-binding subunit ClpC